jgi:hypothetical protein
MPLSPSDSDYHKNASKSQDFFKRVWRDPASKNRNSASLLRFFKGEMKDKNNKKSFTCGVEATGTCGSLNDT